MCDDCFLTEIKVFNAESTWTSFDLELTRKIAGGKVKHVTFIQDRYRGKDDGEDIYECLTCKQGWKLRDPWDFSDGYFLKLSPLEKITKRLTKTQQIILVLCTILLLLVLNVLYWEWTN